MLIIEEILESLKDGKWHDLGDIEEKTGINRSKVGIVTKFLAEFDFIQLDEEKKRARLTSTMFNFFETQLLSAVLSQQTPP